MTKAKKQIPQIPQNIDIDLVISCQVSMLCSALTITFSSANFTVAVRACWENSASPARLPYRRQLVEWGRDSMEVFSSFATINIAPDKTHTSHSGQSY